MKQCFYRVSSLVISVFSVLSIAFSPLAANAAPVCSSGISYFWVPELTTSPVAGKGKSPASENKEGESQATELKVLYDNVQRKGSSEEISRGLLSGILEDKKSEALKSCRELHENLSGCISGKFVSMAPVLRQLDFEARKQLEASITLDCKKNSGRCVKVEASEIQCSDDASGENGSGEASKE